MFRLRFQSSNIAGKERARNALSDTLENELLVDNRAMLMPFEGPRVPQHDLIFPTHICVANTYMFCQHIYVANTYRCCQRIYVLAAHICVANTYMCYKCIAHSTILLPPHVGPRRISPQQSKSAIISPSSLHPVGLYNKLSSTRLSGLGCRGSEVPLPPLPPPRRIQPQEQAPSPFTCPGGAIIRSDPTLTLTING